MPTVSVIMEIYNCETTLSASVDSIINQTYKNWELILCDDGSTDNTYMIAKQYANQYNNIKLIKNKVNKGLAFSLNKCLDIARGKYIARADSDDICLPHRFQTQIEFLNNNPQYDVVGSSAILFDSSGKKGVRQVIEYPNKYDLATKTPFMHPTIMMRRETYIKLGGYIVSKRTRRGQDTDLWFRFFAKGFKGYNIQEPLYKYHESLDDYTKRGIKVRWQGMKTRFLGYKMLDYPLPYYIFLLKPLIAGFVPYRLMYFYHKNIKAKKFK